MKYVKTLALIAMSAATLLATSGTASATLLTQEPSTYTGVLHAQSEGTLTFHGAGTAECKKSTIEGAIEQGGISSSAGGKLEKVTMEECASNHVKVVKPGSIEIHTQEASLNGNGTVTLNGAEIEINFTGLGIKCIFQTTATDIGTLTGSSNTGGTATLDINAVLPRVGGSGFCGSSAEWTGSYTIDTPDYLDVD